MSDEEIIALLREDTHKGLSAAVEQYAAYVHKIAYGKLRDVCSREDIEEAVSDIFVLFLQSGKKRNFEMQSLKAFLGVIAKRHCVNVFRRHCRRAEEIPLDEVSAVIPDENDSRDRERLLNALHSLGATDEQIFLRKYFLGQKSRDIANDMNLKTNTVDKRISRGLVRLRKLLEEDS